jgi:transcriptional regulator with XRE-family HTH domain
MNPVICGERIQALRKRFGLSQTQFAEQLKVTRTAVHYWETGKNFPSIEVLATLAERGATSIDWLLGFQDEANEGKSPAARAPTLGAQEVDIMLDGRVVVTLRFPSGEVTYRIRNV